MHIQSKNKYIFVLYNIFLTHGNIFSIHKGMFPSLYIQTLYSIPSLYLQTLYTLFEIRVIGADKLFVVFGGLCFAFRFFRGNLSFVLVGSFTCLPLAAVSVNKVIIGASLCDLFPAYAVVALWDLVVRVCAWKQCVHVYLCWRLWVDLSDVSEQCATGGMCGVMNGVTSDCCRVRSGGEGLAEGVVCGCYKVCCSGEMRVDFRLFWGEEIVCSGEGVRWCLICTVMTCALSSCWGKAGFNCFENLANLSQYL